MLEFHIHIPLIPRPELAYFRKVFKHGDEPEPESAPEPKLIDVYKHELRAFVKQYYSDAPLSGPIEVSITFLLPRTLLQNAKKAWKGRIYKDLFPALHSLESAVTGALNGLLWIHYRQIVKLSSEKWYHGRHENPGLILTVKNLDPYGTPEAGLTPAGKTVE